MFSNFSGDQSTDEGGGGDAPPQHHRYFIGKIVKLFIYFSLVVLRSKIIFKFMYL
jgi:hypothetical protein